LVALFLYGLKVIALIMWEKQLEPAITNYWWSSWGGVFFFIYKSLLQQQIGLVFDIYILWASTNDCYKSRLDLLDYTEFDSYDKEKLLTQKQEELTTV
jgi:hypothetical protein